MTEDDTFKKLKSISQEEAMEICNSVYNSLVDELGASNGVPIALIRERTDEKLKPYGRTYDGLFDWSNAILS